MGGLGVKPFVTKLLQCIIPKLATGLSSSWKEVEGEKNYYLGPKSHELIIQYRTRGGAWGIL